MIAWVVNLWWRLVFWWKHRAGFLDLGRDVTVVGTVVWTDGGDNPDGDFTFNLKLDDGYGWANTAFGGRKTSENSTYPDTIHCEVAPWTRGRVEPRPVAPGARLRVSGRWGFDGVHTGRGVVVDVLLALVGHGPDVAGGWCEIHPVTSVELL